MIVYLLKILAVTFFAMINILIWAWLHERKAIEIAQTPILEPILDLSKMPFDEKGKLRVRLTVVKSYPTAITEVGDEVYCTMRDKYQIVYKDENWQFEDASVRRNGSIVLRLPSLSLMPEKVVYRVEDLYIMNIDGIMLKFEELLPISTINRDMKLDGFGYPPNRFEQVNKNESWASEQNSQTIRARIVGQPAAKRAKTTITSIHTPLPRRNQSALPIRQRLRNGLMTAISGMPKQWMSLRNMTTAELARRKAL